MRIALSLIAVGLSLAGCKAKEAKPADNPGEPQVATSIEDYALPTDKSDQITAIDAATGDAGGMPSDGGAAVQTKRAPAAIVQAPAESAPANAQAPAAPAKPEFTIQDIPGAN